MEEGDRALNPAKGKHAMNFYQGVAVVLLRVLAAETIFTNAVSLPGYAYSAFFVQENFGELGVQVGAALLIAFYVVAGLALWFLAPPLARKVTAGFEFAMREITISGARIVEIGTFLIGFYYLFSNAPTLVMETASMLYQVAKQTDADRLYKGFVYHGYSPWEIWKGALTVAIALFLTFRPRDIATLFTWLREAGLPPAEEAASAETKPAPGE